MEAKNFMGHDLDEINLAIKEHGFAKKPTFYMINMYKSVDNLVDYFLSHGIKFKITEKMYEFRHI